MKYSIDPRMVAKFINEAAKKHGVDAQNISIEIYENKLFVFLESNDMCLETIDIIPKEQSCTSIVNTICNHQDCDIDLVLTNTREGKITKCRQLCMYFVRKNTKLSLKEIGVLFNRNHATVLFAIKTVKNLCDTDKAYKKNFDEIEKMLSV